MAKELTKESILAALSKVQEPELHKDLVSLNMIRDIKIKGKKVSFTIMLTTPACPLSSRIENDARVWLLDADIYGPNIPTMMVLQAQVKHHDNMMIPEEAHGVKLMSIGF